MLLDLLWLNRVVRHFICDLSRRTCRCRLRTFRAKLGWEQWTYAFMEPLGFHFCGRVKPAGALSFILAM